MSQMNASAILISQWLRLFFFRPSIFFIFFLGTSNYFFPAGMHFLSGKLDNLFSKDPTGINTYCIFVWICGRLKLESFDCADSL